MRRERTFTVTLVAMLTAVCVVCRLFLHPLPSVTPFTALLIMIGWIWPVRISLSVAYLSTVLSGLVLGLHPVIIVQMLLYAALMLAVTGMKRLEPTIYGCLTVALVFTLTYGWWITVAQAPWLFNGFHLKLMVSYWVGGLGFDLAHTITTAMCLLILYVPVQRVAKQYQLFV